MPPSCVQPQYPKIPPLLQSDILYRGESVAETKRTWLTTLGTVLAIIISATSLWWTACGARNQTLADDALNGRIDTRARSIALDATKPLYELPERMARLEGKIEQIDKSLNIVLEKRIRGALALPSDEFDGALPGIRNSFAAARVMNAKLPVKAVTGTWAKLYSAHWNDDKWPVLIELANYRSFLNQQTDPAPPHGEAVSEKERMDWLFNFTVQSEPGVSVYTQLRAVGRTTPGTGARMERLDKPLIQKLHTVAPLLLIVDSASQEQSIIIVLDNVRAKNVIFQNCKILYSGGPMELDNVRFLNCIFWFPYRPATELLASQIAAKGKAERLHTL